MRGEGNNGARDSPRTPQREGLSRSIIPKRYEGSRYTMTIDIVLVHLGLRSWSPSRETTARPARFFALPAPTALSFSNPKSCRSLTEHRGPLLLASLGTRHRHRRSMVIPGPSISDHGFAAISRGFLKGLFPAVLPSAV